MKTAEVAKVEKMPHCEKPCRHCGHKYERGCAGHDTEPEGPLSRCPMCHCPADKPMNAKES